MQQTKLGNMVVKEFLENNNVQLSRFKQFRGKTPAARRRLNRMQGGEISVPLPRTNDQIRQTLQVESFCDICYSQTLGLLKHYSLNQFSINIQYLVNNCLL